MPRMFNTEGPCQPGRHYMLSPLDRAPLVRTLVEDWRYFILHAPRQSGKSTLMAALATELRAQGTVAAWISLLRSRGISEVERAEDLWLDALHDLASLDLPPEESPPRPSELTDRKPGSRLAYALSLWCRRVAPKPVVLLIDEVDAVQGEAMANLLSQLRDGFERRGPGRYPSSIGLIGLRDLRDYLIEVRGRPFHTSSPFNAATSLTLDNFSRDDVARLYAQHTQETGQFFTPEAIDLAHWWTDGQPYLVNALAQHCVRAQVTDRSLPVEPHHIDEAREALTRARVTHLDHLDQRLNEERVAEIIAPILASNDVEGMRSDNLEYCIDLGLVHRDRSPPRIANPWYQEVLARSLAWPRQANLPDFGRAWARPDGRIDPEKMVNLFLSWWREHAELLWEGRGLYREAAAQIVFMAFLQRVVNGGGSIHREYAAGRGRMDLLVSFRGQRVVFELKRVTTDGQAARAKDEGTAQLVGYLDTVGLSEGWLVIFDARPGRSWEERLWVDRREVGGKVVELRGA